ncbi:MAG: putative acyltransferase [Ilumatobacteraceae bacterium]|nr:putative acyltransferase [Ilumatobacteraceae bacterium]
MRALAVVAVMIFHANHDWLSAGFLGVEVFFVISGYLITLLLIAEHERAGFISLRAFWGRRFRRLLPALYLTLVLVVGYCALFYRDPLGKLRGDVVGALFYVSNWYQIWTGQGYAALADFVPLRHLWSLAVEEQFYLIWPLVMVVLLRRGRDRLPQIGLWLIGISLAITIGTAAYFHGGFYATAADSPSAYVEVFGRAVEKNNLLYLGTISRSSGILLGAGFAMLWRPLAINRGPLRDKGRKLDIWAVIGLVGLAALMVNYELFDSFTGTYFSLLFRGGFLLTGLCTLAVIAAVTHSGSLVGRFLGNKVLNWIGTRSYGLYLFHWPIYQIIRKQAGIALTVPKFVMAIAITVVVAEASYRFVETPVRKREFFGWFTRGGTQLMVGLGVAGLVVGYAGVSLATSDVKCTSTIECNSQIADQSTTPTIDPSGSTAVTLPPDPTAITASTLPGATLPGVTTVTVPGESTTTAIPTTTIPTKTVIADLAIGESVMQGAFHRLTDNGVTVDAQEAVQAKGIIDTIQRDLAKYTITNAVIIQSGTNGTVSQADYDQMANLLAGIPHVYFMTVKAPKSWIDGNNAIIKNLPLTHSNVQIIDWANRATEIEAHLSESDGRVHLTDGTAARFYANLILSAVGLPTIPDPVTTTG